MWSLSSSFKIPQQVFYDTDDKIISADYRNDGMHVCLDLEGNCVFRNVNKANEVYIKRLSKQDFNFVKFNAFDEYEFYVSSKDSFKVYDTRTFQEMYEVPQFKGCLDIYNDNCSNYLLSKRDSINFMCYDATIKKFNELKKWDIIDLSCLSINNPSLINPDIISIGCENGDLYHSNLME